MGCGSTSSSKAAVPKDKPTIPQLLTVRSAPNSQKLPESSNAPRLGGPAYVAPAPAYIFPPDYNPEATFRLTVKDLRGGAPFLFDDVKPKLKGRELHGKIKEKSGKLGEMLLVLYGRIVKSDEIEIGKRGLSKEATVYCVYKPAE